MNSRLLATLMFVGVFVMGPSALADGWSLWPFGRQAASVETKSSRSAAPDLHSKSNSKSALPRWSKPAPELRSSRATAQRPVKKNQPSTLSKIVGAPKSIWQKTTSALKPDSKPQTQRTPQKKDSSIWPASWFKPVPEEPEGAQTVGEFMRQPRP